MSSNSLAFVDVARRASGLAQEILLKYYKQNPSTSIKPDNSPVTQADMEAERAIKQYVLSCFPEHAFMGEETGGVINPEIYTWIVDPIDGTKNFIRGIPKFSIEIALTHQNTIVTAVSNNPVAKEMFVASRDEDATCNDKPIQVSSISELNEAYLSFGGIKYFSRTNTLDQLVSLSEQVRAYRGFGDTYMYQLLAKGTIDIVVEANYGGYYDVAAMSYIIERAGGCVTQLDGKPLTIESKTMLATNGKLHESVLKIFND